MDVVLLIALAFTVSVVALLLVTFRPPPQRRIDGFAARYGLDLTPRRQLALVHYLRRTRRLRTLGTVTGGLIGLSWSVPDRKIDLIPLLAGWLVGAVIAEITLRAGSRGPTDDDAPIGSGWLSRLPVAFAGAAAISTALSMWPQRAEQTSAPILAWGLGAMTVALLVAATNSFISRHATTDPDGRSVDRATRTHSTAAVMSVGAMLTVLCMLRQLAIVQGELFGQTASALTGIGFMWLVGALFLSIALWTAAAPGGSARVAGIIAIVLVAGTFGGIGYGRWRDHPPYGPEAVQARGSVRFTDFDHFDGDARALGITGLGNLIDVEDGQNFVGRVDLVLPAGASGEGSYNLVVVDRRTQAVAAYLGGVDGAGSGGYLRDVSRRYPTLLAALTPTRVGDAWSVPSVVPARPAGGPIAFVGTFLRAAPLRPADLLIVLIFFGPQEQIYWAVEVPTSVAL